MEWILITYLCTRGFRKSWVVKEHFQFFRGGDCMRFGLDIWPKELERFAVVPQSNVIVRLLRPVDQALHCVAPIVEHETVRECYQCLAAMEAFNALERPLNSHQRLSVPPQHVT